MSKFCQHCGAETNDAAFFCVNCGSSLCEEIETEECNIKCVEEICVKKEKKPNYKKAFFILFAVTILIVLLFFGLNNKDSNNSSNNFNSNNYNTVQTNKNDYVEYYYAYKFMSDDEVYDVDEIGLSSTLKLDQSNNTFFASLTFDGETTTLSGNFKLFEVDGDLISYALYDGDVYFGILLLDTDTNEYFLQIVDTDVITIYR